MANNGNKVVEELGKARSFAASLAREVDVKNQMIWELERKYGEVSATLSRIKAEKHELQQAYDQATRKMHFLGLEKENMRRDLDWQVSKIGMQSENLKKELACMKEKLASQDKKDKQLSQDDLDRLNLLVEKDKLKAQEIEELTSQLAEKFDEVQDMDTLNQALIIREHSSNQELQDARKELISVFQTLLVGETVGVKRMGEIDDNPFKAACLHKL